MTLLPATPPFYFMTHPVMSLLSIFLGLQAIETKVTQQTWSQHQNCLSFSKPVRFLFARKSIGFVRCSTIDLCVNDFNLDWIVAYVSFFSLSLVFDNDVHLCVHEYFSRDTSLNIMLCWCSGLNLGRINRWITELLQCLIVFLSLSLWGTNLAPDSPEVYRLYMFLFLLIVALVFFFRVWR
jgi:hypothetical protein